MSSRPERENQPGRNPMPNPYCRPIEEREFSEVKSGRAAVGHGLSQSRLSIWANVIWHAPVATACLLSQTL